MLAMTRDTGKPTAAPRSYWLSFSRKDYTQLLSTSSKTVITLYLGMKQVFSRECSVLFLFICCVHFLFMFSQATGTEMLVKRALTTKGTKVSLGTAFCSWRLSQSFVVSDK